jgi:hypothetical protein
VRLAGPWQREPSIKEVKRRHAEVVAAVSLADDHGFEIIAGDHDPGDRDHSVEGGIGKAKGFGVALDEPDVEVFGPDIGSGVSGRQRPPPEGRFTPRPVVRAAAFRGAALSRA